MFTQWHGQGLTQGAIEGIKFLGFSSQRGEAIAVAKVYGAVRGRT